MADANGLYRDAILDHARNPRHSGRLERPDLRGTAANPICGDQLEVTVALSGETIRDVKGLVRGCVIAQASCSLMTELVRNRTLGDARGLGETLQAVLEDRLPALPPELAALAPLVAVKQHRSRIGCALLPWQALASARKP